MGVRLWGLGRGMWCDWVLPSFWISVLYFNILAFLHVETLESNRHQRISTVGFAFRVRCFLFSFGQLEIVLFQKHTKSPMVVISFFLWVHYSILQTFRIHIFSKDKSSWGFRVFFCSALSLPVSRTCPLSGCLPHLSVTCRNWSVLYV